MSDSASHIVNFLQISARLGTAGQPTPAHIGDLGPAGYQVVINLAMPDSREAVVDEDALVTGQGLTYVHLPVPWEAPTEEHLQAFFDLMNLYRHRKVFVHCIRNMRVSVFVFLYRVRCLDTAVDAAWRDVLRIWHPEGAWLRLIQDVLGEDGCFL